MIALCAAVMATALLTALVTSEHGQGGAQDGARTYFVTLDGADSNPGSAERPWASIQHGLEQLSSGDTLLIGGGIYRGRGLDVEVQGTAENPITIKGAPGETVRLDGNIAEFQEPGNDAWVEVADDIALYRSRESYSGDSWYGKIEARGRLVALNVYKSLEAISAPSSDYAENGRYYVGPGLYWDRGTGHIYVRLQAPDPEALHGRRFVPVADPDPRKNGLHIGNRAFGIKFAGAHHVVVENLEIHGYHRPVFAVAGSDLVLRDIAMAAGKTGVILDDGVRNVRLEGLTIEAGFPAWISWQDVKSGPQVADALKLGGVILRADVEDVSIVDSRFVDVFDGIVAVQNPSHLRVLHNEFDRVIDDALQLGTGAAHVEFGHNLVFGPGPSHHGSGSSQAPGTKYIHHNVIHIRDDELYARRGQGAPGWRYHVALPQHAMNKAGPDPWKIYNNTILFWENTNNAGAGQNRKGPRSGPPHEVYNNIFLQQSDFQAARHEQIGDRAEILDGNLYFRPVPAPATPLFHSWRHGDDERHFQSLEAFKTSSFAEATRAHYPPGWEARGLEADPRLRAPKSRDYRPAPDGPAAAGGVDLSSRAWPSVGAQTFRGAVDPGAADGLGDVGVRRASKEDQERRRRGVAG